MTTTAEALLRAVLDNPTDDAVRLIYADWLEERGDAARAEFIRVQVRLGRLAEDDKRCMKTGVPTQWANYTPRCRCSVCRLRQREYYSARRHINWDWLAGLEVAPRIRPRDWQRGFVASITLPTAVFLAHAMALFEAQPIERVVLSDIRPWNAFNTRWGWSVSPYDSTYGVDWVLPQELFELLPPTEAPLPTNPMRRWYSTEVRAQQALSDTCVRYARGLAGLLPPLKG